MPSVALFALALLTALAGWIGGLGPPYREYAYDAAEDLGIGASFLLLPFAVIALWESRGEGIAFSLRLLGWLLCSVGLLLPALLLGNTYLELPGYSAFGCGSLLNPSSLEGGPKDVLAGCEVVRAERMRAVLIAGVVSGLGAALLGWKSLRRPPQGL